MKYKIWHKQAYLEEIENYCDARIAHVIRRLNKINGISTKNSCWNSENKGGGYVNVMTGDGFFIEYLKERLNPELFNVDDSMKNGGAFVTIRPKYEKGLERWQRNLVLDEKWKELLEMSIQFENP